MIKIAIFDEHQIYREAVKFALEGKEIFEVLATEIDYRDIIPTVKIHSPDMLIVEIGKQEMNCYKEIAWVKEKYPSIKIVVLSTISDSKQVASALKAGINGYLLKEMDINEIMDALIKIEKGYLYLYSGVVGCFLTELQRLKKMETEHFVQSNKVRPPLHLLTPRECEVLQLLTNGQSNLGIAKTLFISDKTVKNHVSSILKKVNVKDRTQAVLFAIKSGWVKL